MSLKDEGFRFVLRSGAWVWMHPAEAKLDDVDCTDMTDSQFETLVRSVAANIKKYGKHLHGECYGIRCICGLTELTSSCLPIEEEQRGGATKRRSYTRPNSSGSR